MQRLRNFIIKFNHDTKDINPYKHCIGQSADNLMQTYSEDDFDNSVTCLEDIKSIFGRKWKVNLTNIGCLVDIKKYSFTRKTITPKPISQINHHLVSVFDNQKKVSRILSDCKKIGLIKCVDENFIWKDCGDKDENKAKTYIWNKKVQNIIISICKELGISEKNNKIINDKVNNYKNLSIYINNTHIRKKWSSNTDVDKVSISPRLRLRIGNFSDNEITAILYLKYAQIADYQQLSDFINRKYYEDIKSIWIDFAPNIRRTPGGYVSKIGIRATNSMVSRKANNITEEDEDTRIDFLEDYFGIDNWVEFDVKSSIYRINYFLNHKEWLSQDIDLYELMFGEKFTDTDERNMYKEFAMKLFFGESPEDIAKTLVVKGIKSYGISKENLIGEITEMKDKMTSVIGRIYGSEIFLHESCIYMDLLNYLLGRGLKIFQVYDGFYADKSQISQEELQKVCCEKLPEIAEAYFTKYIDKEY